MAEFESTIGTRTAARIVGPYLVIAALAIVARQTTAADFLAVFVGNEPLVFVTGAFTVVAGLSLFAAHNQWNSFSAAAVSLVAVLATAKGAVLMIAPEFGVEAAETAVRSPALLMSAATVDLTFGLWLTFVGWRKLAEPPAPT